jgi:hypothetical protein
MSALVDDRPRRLDRARDQRGDDDGFLPELDLATRDPRDVQEIVDQAGHVLDLTLDRLARAAHTERLVAVKAHELQRRGHRRERVA